MEPLTRAPALEIVLCILVTLGAIEGLWAGWTRREQEALAQLVHCVLPLQKHTWLTFPERVRLAKHTAHVCQRLGRARERKQTGDREGGSLCVGHGPARVVGCLSHDTGDRDGNQRGCSELFGTSLQMTGG